MTEELHFDSLELSEIPVTIGDKKYVLVEASEDAACQFRNATMAGTQMRGRKVTKLGTMANAAPGLVSRCLFEDDGVGRKAVPVATIYRWPARIIKQLFEWIKKNSDLEEDETLESLREEQAEIAEKIADLERGEDPAKNEPEDTPDTLD